MFVNYPEWYKADCDRYHFCRACSWNIFLLKRSVNDVAFRDGKKTYVFMINYRTIVSYKKKLPVFIFKCITGRSWKQMKFWKISASMTSKIMNVTFIRFCVISSTVLWWVTGGSFPLFQSVWELEKFPIENECRTCFKCLWTFPQVSVTVILSR